MLVITLLAMQRGRNNTVTHKLQILVPCHKSQANYDRTFFLEYPEIRWVRTFTNKDLDAKTTAGRATLGALSARDRDAFLTIANMRAAIKGNDQLALQKVTERLGELSGTARLNVDFRHYLATLSSLPPDHGLALLVTNHLRSARLVLLWSGGTFGTALLCPDVKTALYVRLFMGIMGARTLRICPHCGEPFLQDRPDQDYCLVAHREAHRVARWRARKKLKAQKQGGKHGAQKTR